ncbi:MAG: cupin domain-containing protein [Candidatus Gorgyraea atricola]|nr:cupin domain-containing protein [Candidatus Gorgyraea atricola]
MAKNTQARLIKLESMEKYQRLFSKDSGTAGIKAGHVILQPGQSVGAHTTGEREEVIIVLKGNGEAKVGKDSIFKLEKDVVLYIPPRTDHDVKNNSSVELEYIFVTADVFN